MDTDPFDRKAVVLRTVRLGGFNYSARSRKIFHGYLPTSATMAPLLVQ